MWIEIELKSTLVENCFEFEVLWLKQKQWNLLLCVEWECWLSLASNVDQWCGGDRRSASGRWHFGAAEPKCCVCGCVWAAVCVWLSWNEWSLSWVLIVAKMMAISCRPMDEALELGLTLVFSWVVLAVVCVWCRALEVWLD